MKLSARIEGITGGGGDGWSIYRRASALRAQGIDVTMLAIGDHDRTTPEEIIAAMAASARGGNTGYAPLRGSEALRAAIAARAEARTGVPTAREEVVVCPGGQSALFTAFTACCDPGDRAVIVDPYYATYPLTVRAVGAEPVTVAARAERGFQLTAEDLDRAATGARVLLVNSPNNPTGAVYSADTVAAIAEVARRRDLWVISDEVYEGQVWEGAHLSPRALEGMAERTVVIGSLSKSHVMTGFRLGWLIGPAALCARVEDLMLATTYGVPGFIQDAGLHALTEGAALEAETAALYARRRAVALAALRGVNGVSVSPPEGGMYLMLDIRATGLTGLAFAERLLEEAHVAVMPGESFGAAASGHLRVALTVEDEALEEALRRLASLAGRLADRRDG